jgi:DNA-binding Lrp family transcriptional regulator
VINRVNEMMEEGIIKGFIPEVDSRKLGFGITALIGVSATGPSLIDVEKEISKNENVLGVYDVTGNFDVIILAKFRNTEDLDKFIKSLQKIERIQRTETFVVLNTIKETGKVPVHKLLS